MPSNSVRKLSMGHLPVESTSSLDFKEISDRKKPKHVRQTTAREGKEGQGRSQAIPTDRAEAKPRRGRADGDAGRPADGRE